MVADTTRLYISPLTPDLLPKVLGSILTAAAKNISYHEIQTFPENSYGYLELPIADADRLKKKLAGSILRGSKMKVEEARPKKRRRAEDEEAQDQAGAAAKSRTKSEKRRKADNVNTIQGHELGQERKVQRGWTESKKDKSGKKSDKKTQKQPSKYTDKEELLFKTQVPANKADLAAKTSKKSRKAKHNALDHTVHEFSNTTTQPSFLKSEPTNSRPNLEYVDGKGWVDDVGELVEGEPISVRRSKEQLDSKRKRSNPMARQKTMRQTSRAESSSSDTSSESSLSSSSGDESDDEAETSNAPGSYSQNVEGKTDDEQVHPLESLFKKPQKPASQDVAKPSLEIHTGFSFFEGTSDDVEDEPEVPLTPFSQDVRSRGLRSAAPTPDTAHPSRFNSYDSGRFAGDDDSGDEEDEVASNAEAVKETREGSPKQLRSKSNASDNIETSEFEKLFWEKRGENNRAWKGRRRAVLKEKRHRENRSRRPKNW